MKSFVLLALLSLVACAHVEPESRPLRAIPEYGTLTPDPSESRFILVAQWHLSPQTTTNLEGNNQLPQSENQLAIYHQLSDWVRTRGLQTIIAEGCEGTINDSFKEKFNGWSLDDLKKLTPEQLDGVMTHVALKLKAEFGDKIKVSCGDDLKLVKKHQLILSDLRGLLGFKMRLVESRGNKSRHDDYLQALNSVLKLPSKSKSAVTEATLNRRLKDLVEDFDKILKERNGSVLKAMHKAMGRTALVIGALHIRDLSDRLHDDGDSSALFTPVGLKGDESQLVDEIRALLGKNL